MAEAAGGLQHAWEVARFTVGTETGKTVMLAGHDWSGVLQLNPSSASQEVFEDYLKTALTNQT